MYFSFGTDALRNFTLGKENVAFIHPVKLRHQTKSPREHPQNEFLIFSVAPPS